MKICTVVGARPQFVKAAVLSRLIKSIDDVSEVLIHTGQHFDKQMSDVFFEQMEIPKPHYNFHINSVGHGAMTGRMLEKCEEAFLDEKPDVVVVYGDTNSTLAAALAASKLHIPICHVEAGLRSFEMRMPEEVNRILTDRISSLLCCPTQTAVENLKNEGYENIETRIVNTGDVMCDAALYYKRFVDDSLINNLGVSNGEYVLATIHRQENTDDKEKISSIVDALNLISESREIILPLHPRTKKMLEQFELKLNATIIPPVSYFEMVSLLANCELVLTDSGGVQKEAYFFGKNSVVLREQTEWVELSDNNFNAIVGVDSAKIVNAFENRANFNKDFSQGLYGNGDAGKKILENLIQIPKY